MTRPTHRPTYHRAALAAVALALTGALTGCSVFGGSDSEGHGQAKSVVAEGADVAKGKPSVDGAGKPVVQGTFPSAISSGATVDIAIFGLKARGKLATLTVRYTPHIPPGGDGNPNPYNLNGGNNLGTSLIDPVNLKRYVVVSDSNGKPLQTDDIFAHVANNQAGNFYYTFAAPPENVKAMDVQIGSWPTFRNVPVER
ncbi:MULTISPECIES: hypothetical protein [Actinomadura]|uniref:DUF4352 domain-containing protein n=1 Tax=Actinomadura yumaensis TaxID=111807 RepID=A0ABW2C991_9ACTN|nr:hypothetical protein [Actinomadura sp. J1-007]